MDTTRWILPLAGAGLLAAASMVGLERTDELFEPVTNAELQVSWDLERDSAPAPARAVVVPAGTPVAILLDSELSTRTAQPGDRFHARVAAPVRVHGRVVIPRGAEIEGHVATSDPPGSGVRPGRMQLTYELVRFDGRAYGLNSKSRMYEGAVDPEYAARLRVGPDMIFDAGATLEFELDENVSMMTAGETI